MRKIPRFLGVLLLALTAAGCPRDDPAGIEDGYCPDQDPREPFVAGCAVIEGWVRGIGEAPLWGARVSGVPPDSLRAAIAVRPYRTERDGWYRLVVDASGPRTLGFVELTLTADPFTSESRAARDTTLVIYFTPPGGTFHPFDLDFDLEVEAIN